MKGVISVFGSSAPQEGSADFENARTVGRLLAEARVCGGDWWL